MTINKIIVLLLSIILFSSLPLVYAQNPRQSTQPINLLFATLNSVYIINNANTSSSVNITSLDAWAVGETGVIMHWNGTQWILVNSPTTDTLYGLWMINSSSGWAVGGSPTNGTILYFDGQNWIQWAKIFNSATNNVTIPATLNSVTFDSNGTTGWIAGAQGYVLNWNGTYWNAKTQGNLTLRAVSIPHQSNNAWVAGDNGTILQWNGNSWTNNNSTVNATLRSISMVNQTAGWAVGGDGSQGVILAMNSSGWNKWTKISFSGNSSGMDAINVTLNALSMATPDSGLTVGNGGWSLYWNGNYWAGQTGVIALSLNSVSMPENITTAAWTVGAAGAMLAWNGTGWTSLTLSLIQEISIPSLFIVSLTISAVMLLPVILRKIKPKTA